MPRAKQSSRRKKFDYSQNRKKLQKQFKKREAPRIECEQIRGAWNDRQSVAKNLLDMGLAFDPNQALPIQNRNIFTKEKNVNPSSSIVMKPYVINQMEVEARLPGKNTKSLSTDLIEYVQHMVREHNDNYKAMARDEKNYYQDTPKQIKRKIVKYKRFYPKEYESFMKSLNRAGEHV